MKLYLSSYYFGENPQDLANLFEKNKNVAIIQNAQDAYTDTERREANLQREIAGLAKIGLKGERLELKQYFGRQKALVEKLQKYGGLWVMGGNTFVLRLTYKESGLDTWLRQQKGNNVFVYAGYSAGACVLAPSLKGIHLADEPDAVERIFRKPIIWDGLNLIPYMPVPHYKSDHPESPLMERVVRYLAKEGIPYKTLRDGDVIIIDSYQNETTREFL